jgi:hypothetical protein
MIISLKKMMIILVLGLSLNIWAETYPGTLIELLTNYKDQNISVDIVMNSTAHSEYLGNILLVQKDYIVLKETDGDVVVLNISNIVEMSHA